jgi:hypothetical protein
LGRCRSSNSWKVLKRWPRKAFTRGNASMCSVVRRGNLQSINQKMLLPICYHDLSLYRYDII